MTESLEISVCIYTGKKEFDVMLRCPDSGMEVTLTGQKEFTDEQVHFLGDKAPPCVMTRYVLHESADPAQKEEK